INAVLEAQETPRNEALTILREELALEAAQDMMLDDLITAEELVAGGATVEELARETAFELASASVTTTGALGVPAEDIEFITAAFSADQGLETDPVEGASGRIYVLRIDAIIPPQVPPLAEIEDEVLVDWRNAQAITAARAAADALLLSSGDALADGAARFGGEVTTTPPVTRDGNAAGLPPGALAEVFEADEAGTLFTFNRDDGVVIARLDAIEPFAAEDGSVLSDFISQRQAEGLATDLVAYFATARANERGLSVD
ncbi:MAG: peptidylprolyl isomerase, partial [Pseudomonadota bacterium]